MFFEENVTAFEGQQRVQRVVTSSGRRIDCDFVVVGVGVEPVTDIVNGTAVRIENVRVENRELRICGCAGADDGAASHHFGKTTERFRGAAPDPRRYYFDLHAVRVRFQLNSSRARSLQLK